MDVGGFPAGRELHKTMGKALEMGRKMVGNEERRIKESFACRGENFRARWRKYKAVTIGKSRQGRQGRAGRKARRMRTQQGRKERRR